MSSLLLFPFLSQGFECAFFGYAAFNVFTFFFSFLFFFFRSDYVVAYSRISNEVGLDLVIDHQVLFSSMILRMEATPVIHSRAWTSHSSLPIELPAVWHPRFFFFFFFFALFLVLFFSRVCGVLSSCGATP